MHWSEKQGDVRRPSKQTGIPRMCDHRVDATFWTHGRALRLVLNPLDRSQFTDHIFTPLHMEKAMVASERLAARRHEFVVIPHGARDEWHCNGNE